MKNSLKTCLVFEADRCHSQKKKTQARTYWKTVEVAFISFNREKNCCDIGFDHWAETNIHTVPLNGDWHSGAVRLEDASDTCTRARTHNPNKHTYSPGRPPMHTHCHFSFTLAILHIYCCSCSNRITAPPLRCSQSERRGVKSHPQIHIPCVCLSSQANSGMRGDITQRPQPYVSVVHRRSNMTPGNNTAGPAATGLEGRVLGVFGPGHALARDGEEEPGTIWEDGAVGHLVERRVGSEAVGGGGGPRRSRSSI